MKLQIKKLNENAVLPNAANPGDAGLDLIATSIDYNVSYLEYGTGLAVAIPSGHVGLLFARSSVSDRGLLLANGVGVIDSGYRGELKVRFKVVPTSPVRRYEVGDKIAQLVIVPIPSVSVEEVQDLDSTERGQGGFGSTDQPTTKKRLGGLF